MKNLTQSFPAKFEKFEANTEVVFAIIILLTLDDEGYPFNQSNRKQVRARQNVIFELRYFMAELGRKHTCALYVPGVEILSDFLGVAYCEFEAKGKWKSDLKKRIASCWTSIC